MPPSVAGNCATLDDGTGAGHFFGQMAFCEGDREVSLYSSAWQSFCNIFMTAVHIPPLAPSLTQVQHFSPFFQIVEAFLTKDFGPVQCSCAIPPLPLIDATGKRGSDAEDRVSFQHLSRENKRLPSLLHVTHCASNRRTHVISDTRGLEWCRIVPPSTRKQIQIDTKNTTNHTRWLR